MLLCTNILLFGNIQLYIPEYKAVGVNMSDYMFSPLFFYHELPNTMSEGYIAPKKKVDK